MRVVTGQQRTACRQLVAGDGWLAALRQGPAPCAQGLLAAIDPVGHVGPKHLGMSTRSLWLLCSCSGALMHACPSILAK